jgi:chromosomal replication initiation ATPase DnaA
MKLSQEQCDQILDWIEGHGYEIDRDAFEHEFLIAAHMKRLDKASFNSFMDYTATVVCEYMGIPREDFLLKSHIRLRHYIMARAYFYWIVGAEMPYISLQKVGAFVGGKDHATVIHNRRRLSETLEFDKATYYHFTALCDIFADAGFKGPAYKLSKVNPIWNKPKESWLRA